MTPNSELKSKRIRRGPKAIETGNRSGQEKLVFGENQSHRTRREHMMDVAQRRGTSGKRSKEQLHMMFTGKEWLGVGANYAKSRPINKGNLNVNKVGILNLQTPYK